MKSLRYIIFASIEALGAGLCINAMRDAELTADESAQRALIAQAAARIDEYYLLHGEFPSSLSQISLTYPDGGTSTMLTDIHYVRSLDSCSLRSVGYKSGDTILYKKNAEQASAGNP